MALVILILHFFTN